MIPMLMIFVFCAYGREDAIEILVWKLLENEV